MMQLVIEHRRTGIPAHERTGMGLPNAFLECPSPLTLSITWTRGGR
jgi:hypothetical protein